MRFEIEHQFSAPPPQVAETILDPAFQDSLNGITDVLAERELLSQEERDGLIVRRVRCVLGVDLGRARRFVGDGEPAWVEEATWDPGAMAWTWVIHPEIAKELLSAHGNMSLADGSGGTSRVVDGDVKVRVPLYGGRVEKVIVEGLTKAYEAEAEHLADWLASRH